MAEMVAIRSSVTGGKGAGVSLDSNSCNATSTGGSFIILDAEGRGGNGGYTDTGFGGDGGAAAVSLNKTVSASSLTMKTVATGGTGGFIDYDGNVGFSGGGNGGSATAASIGMNMSGSILLTAQATGATGGGSVSGGDLGDGGFATSTAMGMTPGDYAVTVSSSAQGGDGRIGATVLDPIESLMLATEAQLRPPPVEAIMVFKLSTLLPQPSVAAASEGLNGGSNGVSGDATATATAFGLGAVSSTAMATGTFFPPPYPFNAPGVPGGAALARANATGQSGTAFAVAVPHQPLSHRYTLLPSRQSMAARALNRAPESAEPRLSSPWSQGLQSASFITAQPANISSVSAAIVQGLFDNSNSKRGTGSGGTLESEIALSIDLTQIVSLSNLQIHFLNPVTSGNGFDSLTFQIFRENIIVESDTFTDVASATDFFTDHTLDFGPAGSGVTGNLDLEFLVTLTGSQPSGGFGLSYTAAVPEPETVGLLLSGIVPLLFFCRKVRSVRSRSLT